MAAGVTDVTTGGATVTEATRGGPTGTQDEGTDVLEIQAADGIGDAGAGGVITCDDHRGVGPGVKIWNSAGAGEPPRVTRPTGNEAVDRTS